MRAPLENEELFVIEDKLLQEELKEKVIVDAFSLEEIEPHVVLWKWDITCIKADFIVNAWNEKGLGCFIPKHHCIDNAIQSAAWMRLRRECYNKLCWKLLEIWDVLCCNGYNLPSTYVLTTVGPEVTGMVESYHEQALEKVYRNVLEFAIGHWGKTIVLPSLSTWVFWFPIQKAKLIAVRTVREFLKKHDIKVVFNLFTDYDFKQYKELF